MQMDTEIKMKRGRGRPRMNPNEPKKLDKFTVYLEPSRIAEMKHIALEVGLTPSSFARTAICQHMLALKHAA
jgi:hypothetical protein